MTTTDGDKVRAARDALYRRFGVTLVDDKILTDLDNLAAYLDKEDAGDAEILRRERDEAIARAEAAEVTLSDYLADDTDTFDGVVGGEPWRVLRAAADIIDALDRQPADTTPVLVDTSHGPNRWYALRAAADHLEAEHAAKSRRDELIEKAREAFEAESGIDTSPADRWMEAVVDAVLAEAADQ